MSRSSGLRWSAAVAACLLFGCSSPLASRSPRLLGSSTPKKQIASEPADNPLKKRPEKKDSQVTTADAKIEAKPDGSKSSDIQLVSQDVDTLKLIDEELKHVPPEEREQLQKDLKALDPTMVRFVLRNMKMARQAEQPDAEKPTATAEQAGGTSVRAQAAGAGTALNGTAGAAGALKRDPAVTKTKGPQAKARFDSFTADAGLGSADPWNQYASNAADAYQSHQSVAPIAAASTGEPRIPTAGSSTGIIVTPGPSSSGAPGAAPAGGREAFGHSSMYNSGATGPVITPEGASKIAAPAHAEPQHLDAQNSQVADLPVAPLQTPLPPAGQLMPAVAAGNPLANAAAPGATALLPDAALDDGLAASRAMGKQFGTGPPNSLDNSKWHEELQHLISVAEAETAQTPAGSTDEQKQIYLRNHVHLRMLYLMAGHQERALEAIPGIDAGNQEFWQQVFWGVANYFDDRAMPHMDDRATQTIAQLRSAIQRLQENAKLELSHVSFCHKITSFGSYDRFPRDEFSPGQPVLVYAEVNNFKSEPAADGQFRTILRSTVEIYRAGPNGELVDRFEFPATEDLCRNFRRDYFHSYEFSMPQRISLGPHVLKLTVEDQLSQKVATNTLNFTVK